MLLLQLDRLCHRAIISALVATLYNIYHKNIYRYCRKKNVTGKIICFLRQALLNTKCSA